MEGSTLMKKPIRHTRIEEQTFGIVKDGARANVVFGKLSKDCAGIGICKVIVNAIAATQHSHCQHCKVIIRKRHPDQIEFYFVSDSICQKSRRRFFQREFFHVGESFYLPGAITGWLGLKNPIIKAGDYPMKKMKDYILVVFYTG